MFVYIQIKSASLFAFCKVLTTSSSIYRVSTSSVLLAYHFIVFMLMSNDLVVAFVLFIARFAGVSVIPDILNKFHVSSLFDV